MLRPHYGDTFRLDRVLRTFFYTSNSDKLLQARLVFSRYGQVLQHYRGNREPYDEDESLGTNELLTRAVSQVSAEFGIRSVFFVEDTSLRIEALSEEGDFPGLSVKQWFSGITFEELNRLIEIRGGDRRATIKSDIALKLPSLSRPIFFHGEVSGHVAATPPSFQASVQYPWLTPLTFNGWFIPNGSTKRLGEMEFEESLDFDFRAKALINLIGRIEELNASINLSPALHISRRSADRPQNQLWLPGTGPSPQIILVVGYKCSGKTTLSDYLASRDRVHLFEASTVLRDLSSESGHEIRGSGDAVQFLRDNGMDVVARRLVDYMERIGPGLRIVTGLRTPEEILAIRRRFRDAKVLLVECDARTRFERHIRRARDKDVKTFKEFQAQDEEQREFGVMRVVTEIADYTIHNNATLDRFFERIDDSIPMLVTKDTASGKDGELYRCLRALNDLGRTATCDDIASRTKDFGVPVRTYNTNRALKAVPEFAERVERRGKPLSYRLTVRGRELLKLMVLRKSSEDDGSAVDHC